MEKRGLSTLVIVLIIIAIVVVIGIIYFSTTSTTEPQLGIKPPPVVISAGDCSDTDGGFEVLIKGTISGNRSNNNQTYKLTDFCRPDNITLVEYFCDDNRDPRRSNFYCPQINNYSCSDGICQGRA